MGKGWKAEAPVASSAEAREAGKVRFPFRPIIVILNADQTVALINKKI